MTFLLVRQNHIPGWGASHTERRFSCDKTIKALARAVSQRTIPIWSGRYFASGVTLDILQHACAPRRRCLARIGQWQTSSDQRQLFVRAIRCQHNRIGVAESVAPARTYSSAKYWRTLADR